MNCSLRQLLRLSFCLCFLLIFQQAVAVVNVAISPERRISLTPGIDLVRETVANLTVNTDQAYTISISDNSNGKLVNTYHSIPYRMSYNNGFEISLTANPTVVETGGAITNGSRTLAISVRGSDTATAAAGDYSATITVTITGF